jgi:hypothetical protein
LIILLLLAGLACRAISGLQPTQQPAIGLPSPTMVPLPSVTPPADAPQSSEGQPPAEATQVLPEAVATDLPFIIAGTPYGDDSYRSVKVFPGAQNVSESEDILNFTTTASAEEVMGFYLIEMEADGWEFLGGETEAEANKVLIYAKEDKLATIAITQYPEMNNLTMVILSVSQ